MSGSKGRALAAGGHQRSRGVTSRAWRFFIMFFFKTNSEKGGRNHSLFILNGLVYIPFRINKE